MTAAGRRLFAYGTLMVPAVLAAVCGERRAAAPATLAGYARYLVRGEVFPGLVAETGAVTDGVLYKRITPAMWARIDAFETTFYERVRVTVSTDGGDVAAETYVVRPAGRRLVTREPFDPARFEATQLGVYLARYGRAS